MTTTHRQADASNLRALAFDGHDEEVISAIRKGRSSGERLDALWSEALRGVQQGGRACSVRRLALLAAEDVADPAHTLYVAGFLSRCGELSVLARILLADQFKTGATARQLALAAALLASVNSAESGEPLLLAALAKESRNAAALHILGNLRTFQGRGDDAEELYNASLASDPYLYQNSWMLSSLRRQSATKNHVDRLRKQLARVSKDGNGRIYVPFALHKELHDLGEHDEAWRMLMLGCGAKREQVRYDPSEYLDLFARIERSQLPSSSKVGVDDLPWKPVFIVGMHRTGSTLVERILAGHPAFASLGETHNFQYALEQACGRMGARRQITADLYQHCIGVDPRRICAEYMRITAPVAGAAQYVTEKLPQNFWAVDLILNSIPGARVIHVFRPALDTCFSNLRQLFGEAAPYSYRMGELAGFHQLYTRVMDLLTERHGSRIFNLSYEALTSAPAAETSRLSRFLGIRFDEEMLSIERRSGSVLTASHSQVRSKLFKSEEPAWLPYIGELGPLQEMLDSAAAGAAAQSR